jgi:acyl-CoA synthetase (AMP-forming)/AMP-acid ligase II
LCTSGRHARGYLDEPDKTRETFTVFEGRNLVISGDRVRLKPDGTIELLGRNSMVINSGGEKIFVEEVEVHLRRLPFVVDALVVGRPHERWGSEVAAVVQVEPGTQVGDEELRSGVAEHLARYKIPRVFVRADRIRRGPNGKGDYAWARRLVTAAS